MKQDTLLMGPQPMPLMEQQPKAKSVKISTPIGEVESDSGNHMIDIITIVGIIAILYAGKKLIGKFIR
jgi:hypothetical protein